MKEREVNWDFAVIQRLDKASLTSRLLPFNLGIAILGNQQENLLLQPGDIVTIYAANEALQKTEADMVLQGSLLGAPARRFAWREGMKVTDVIPDARWLCQRPSGSCGKDATHDHVTRGESTDYGPQGTRENDSAIR